jgi:putative peptide zinc metalloprotease protein
VIWRVTEADTMINHLALVVVLYSGLQTLVNFNPLIKLDGYYMLSDYLEIPNLRSKAVSGLWERISRKGKPVPPFREQRAQVLYGIAAVLFSSTLLVYIYSALYTWATSRYAFSGLVGFVMFSTYTLRRTAAESIAGIRAVASRAAIKRGRNFGIAAAAILVSFVTHWELKVNANFRILPQQEAIVRAETAGNIGQIAVHEGSTVRKGDLLARLQDFDKQKKASEIEGELREKRSQLELLMAGARPEEIEQRQRAVETKTQELANTTRIDEEKSKYRQMLVTKESQLEAANHELARAQEGLAAGVIPRVEVDKNESAVKIRQSEKGEIEASLRSLDEVSQRDGDLKKKELEEARTALRLIKAGNRPEQIHQLEAEIAKLETQLRLLNVELEKIEIRAPIDGVVTTPFVERMVNQYLPSGGELLHLVETRHVTAEMLVPEKELADVHSGNPVALVVRSFPGRDFGGRVDWIAPVAQTVETNHMVVVRADLPNEDQALKPEMTGLAKIYCGRQRVIDLVTRPFRRWVQTEFWDLLP